DSMKRVDHDLLYDSVGGAALVFASVVPGSLVLLGMPALAIYLLRWYQGSAANGNNDSDSLKVSAPNRFNIRDLLVLTIAIAIAGTVGKLAWSKLLLQESIPTETCLSGAMLGTFVALAWQVFRSSQPWLLSLTFSIGLVLGLPLLIANSLESTDLLYWTGAWNPPAACQFIALTSTVAMAGVTAWQYLVGPIGWLRDWNRSRQWIRWIGIAIAIVGIVTSLRFYAFLLQPRLVTIGVEPPIAGNRYNEFLEVARLLSEPQSNEADFKALLSKAREIVEGSEPLIAQTRIVDGSYEFPDFMQLRQVAANFITESGRLSTVDGDIEGATRELLTVSRLGVRVAGGGLFIDRLIGTAIYADAYRALVVHRADWNDEQLDWVKQRLLADEKFVESWTSMAEREIRYAGVSNGFFDLLSAYDAFNDSLDGVLDTKIEIERISSVGPRDFARDIAELRLLLTDCAIRQYEQDVQALPKSLADLVPKYLDSVPLDPWNDQPIRFVVENANKKYRVYCVGYDGSDDGGTPGNVAIGDFVLFSVSF
ncbi:MAG: hypothetical protein AB8B91_24605, partial [Rubripirellula sp.]